MLRALLRQPGEAQRVQEHISPRGPIQKPDAHTQFSKRKLRFDIQQFLNDSGRLLSLSESCQTCRKVSQRNREAGILHQRCFGPRCGLVKVSFIKVRCAQTRRNEPSSWITWAQSLGLVK